MERKNYLTAGRRMNVFNVLLPSFLGVYKFYRHRKHWRYENFRICTKAVGQIRRSESLTLTMLCLDFPLKPIFTNEPFPVNRTICDATGLLNLLQSIKASSRVLHWFRQQLSLPTQTVRSPVFINPSESTIGILLDWN